jgi:hypothetical protein
MKRNTKEIKRRSAVAFAAIKRMLNKSGGKYSVSYLYLITLRNWTRRIGKSMPVLLGRVRKEFSTCSICARTGEQAMRKELTPSISLCPEG